jgi:thioredoxin-like negative regulator of GroEL
MAAATALTHETFSGFVNAHEFAVIPFWAVWNGHDVQVKKTLESLSEEWFVVSLGGLESDTPAHWDICRAHQIMSLPFVAFYRDGSLASSFTNLRTPEIVSKYLSDLLGSPK